MSLAAYRRLLCKKSVRLQEVPPLHRLIIVIWTEDVFNNHGQVPSTAF